MEEKDYQSRCLEYLLCTSRDTFFTQPTGSGKSLVYKLFPFALEHLQAQQVGIIPTGKQTKNIVLIVSPLSLMKDQIAKLVDGFGLSAFNLSDAKDVPTREKLKNGEFTFVFGSPEAFFVDKSHCV